MSWKTVITLGQSEYNTTLNSTFFYAWCMFNENIVYIKFSWKNFTLSLERENRSCVMVCDMSEWI